MLGRLQMMYINMIQNVEKRSVNLKIKSQVVVDFKSKGTLWYSLFSHLLIPHSFSCCSFILVSVHFSTISADTDKVKIGRYTENRYVNETALVHHDIILSNV